VKPEDVAEFMLRSAREFMPADERRDPDAAALARELLADEMGPVIMRMCILAHNAGIKRGLELAKEHAAEIVARLDRLVELAEERERAKEKP
jgi:hypothetical protein